MNEENSVEIIHKVEPATPTSLRVDVSEDFILLTFGNMEEDSESKKHFSVLASVRISPKAFCLLTSKLIETGFLYEEKYNKKIGFSDSLKDGEE